MEILNLFKRKTEVKKSRKKRAFKGARSSRLTNWLFSGFTKINADTKQDLAKLIVRCRDLCKNN
jgi:hypothetical protein